MAHTTYTPIEILDLFTKKFVIWDKKNEDIDDMKKLLNNDVFLMFPFDLVGVICEYCMESVYFKLKDESRGYRHIYSFINDSLTLTFSIDFNSNGPTNKKIIIRFTTDDVIIRRETGELTNYNHVFWSFVIAYLKTHNFTPYCGISNNFLSADSQFYYQSVNDKRSIKEYLKKCQIPCQPDSFEYEIFEEKRSPDDFSYYLIFVSKRYNFDLLISGITLLIKKLEQKLNFPMIDYSSSPIYRTPSIVTIMGTKVIRAFKNVYNYVFTHFKEF